VHVRNGGTMIAYRTIEIVESIGRGRERQILGEFETDDEAIGQARALQEARGGHVMVEVVDSRLTPIRTLCCIQWSPIWSFSASSNVCMSPRDAAHRRARLPVLRDVAARRRHLPPPIRARASARESHLYV